MSYDRARRRLADNRHGNGPSAPPADPAASVEPIAPPVEPVQRPARKGKG